MASSTPQQAVGRVAALLSDALQYVAPVPIDPTVQQVAATTANVLGHSVRIEASVDAADAIAQVYAALKQGQLVTLVARSPAALGAMLPTLFQLSRAMLPAVVHVLARGHSDLMLVRDAGVAILAPLRASEAKDMAIVAHVAALRTHVPFLHVVDSHIAESVLVDEDVHVHTTQLAKWIGLQQEDESNVDAFRQLVTSDAVNKAPNAELFFQEGPERNERFQQVPSVVEQVIAEAFGSEIKSYSLVEYVGPSDATQVIVALGSTAAVFQDVVQQQTANVGVVLVRLFRPWPTHAFLHVLPHSVQRVTVVDRIDVDDSTLELGAPLFLSVVESLHDSLWPARPLPEITSVTLAVPSSDVDVDVLSVRHIVDQLIAGSEVQGVVSSSTALETTTASTNKSKQDSVSAGYSTMLQQLFGRRAVIANLLHSATVWHEGDAATSVDSARLESSEFGLGLHLALLAKRKQLKTSVQAWLASQAGTSAPSQSTRLAASLQQWLDIATPSDALVEELAALVDEASASDASLIEIASLRQYFARPSQWILGSEAFSRDLSASGVHQVLASGENVNLLILDTEPMDQVSKTQRKRDIGLYAMQYGNAYVASVALLDSSALVLRALSEADAFEGPSIVLAYAPSCKNAEEETKQAITSSYWPLYRYNPRLEDVAGEHAFALESASIKKEFTSFLERNNQLSLFAKEAMTTTVTPSVTSKLQQLEKQALQSSFQALLQGLNSEQEAPWQRDIKLTILVGSDNGHAEDIATRFQEEAARLGLLDVTKSDMNDAGIDLLQEIASSEASGRVVLFVCATAGQGEFPANAKTLWDQVSGYSSQLPINYAVFGMGDSNYWTREDEKHYFCRAPRELDRKLSELGAQRLVEVAAADDQDEDGPSTRYEAWKASFWEKAGVPLDAIAQAAGAAPKQRTVEEIKLQSNYLRGTIAQALDDHSTTAIPADDTQLIKFHGMYMQDDRDQRAQTAEGKVHTFMIRMRVPCGITTTAQYLMIDQMADDYGNGNIKVTTRQAYQLQGVLKWNLRATLQGMNRVMMDSLAGAGDVNRNTMASSTPACAPEVYQEILDAARSISAHLLPRTSAYHEIWLNHKIVSGGAIPDVEPYYGKAYLPRKFKIAVAIPPSNDVDVYANCLGFIAIIENNQLVGFNVTVGGGMGMTHNNQKTFPRLADVLGFCTTEQAQDIAEKVLVQQRDLGDRKDRRHARYKYTVEDHGAAWIRDDLERRLGYKLKDAKPFKFDSSTDRLGWHKMSGTDKKFFYTLFLEGGRIKDTTELKIRTGLRTLAHQFPNVEFHLTPNQNLSIVNIDAGEVADITAVLQRFHFGNDQHSAMRLGSIACAALPFCPLAFAEGERFLPKVVSELEDVLTKYNLTQEAIGIRMTGCANGCGRPYLGEIGLVGRAPGIYNLYLGAGFAGDRLNKLYKQDVAAGSIVNELTPIIADYAKNRQPHEKFGDFVIRQKYVEPCHSGPFIKDRAPGVSFHA